MWGKQLCGDYRSLEEEEEEEKGEREGWEEERGGTHPHPVLKYRYYVESRSQILLYHTYGSIFVGESDCSTLFLSS